MFEQSLLLDDSVAKKSGAFAASLSAQILFTGVLILMPLAYQEVAPLIRLSIPLAVPVLSPPPPVEVQPQTHASAPTLLHRPSRGFVAPRTVPTAPVQRSNEMFDDPQPLVTTSDNAGGPPLLSGNIGIASLENVAQPHTAVSAPTHTADALPVHVGGAVLAAQLIKKVVPIYPTIALKARISGTVRLEGILTKEGTIRNLQVLSGHPLLVAAAIEAVRQWVYRPTLLNGVPVEVIAPIDVVFRLN